MEGSICLTIPFHIPTRGKRCGQNGWPHKEEDNKTLRPLNRELTQELRIA
jgi:hypothetical protein